MNKSQRLIKKLIKYGIFAAIVIIVNLSIYIFLSGYSESLETEEGKIERETRKISRENSELLSKHQRAKASLDLYNRLVGNNAENTFTVEKNLITRLLSNLNSQYQLRNLQLELKPVEYKKEEPFTLKTGTLIASDVVITFESITDSFSYAFLESVQDGLSNFLLVRNFNIQKTGDINDLLIENTEQNAIPTLTKGSLEFRWIGLKVDNAND